MDVHLIEAPISANHLHVWAEERGLFPGRTPVDDGVALHHLLGEVFGPRALQPFVFKRSQGSSRAKLYAYADMGQEDLVNAAELQMTPSTADVIDLSKVRSLHRPAAKWSVGMEIGFDVRIRPIVQRKKEANGKNRVAETDAYVAQFDRDGENQDREGVYLDWLAPRLAPAATLIKDRSRMSRFQIMKSHRKGKNVGGPEAEIQGTMRIEEPEAFAQMLANGVGRHKAYGYGMLLLRPAQRRAA